MFHLASALTDMRSLVTSLTSRFAGGAPNGLQDDDRPIRAELFGVERLEQHAHSLAEQQAIAPSGSAGKSLVRRLKENERVLLEAYRAIAAHASDGRPVAPAAEWLLDNFHLVEQQVREVRTDLPDGYYRELPKLIDGPLAGYPRVYGIAWAFVAHTDSRFDPDTLTRFVRAYQTVQPLSIGELWAVAITLRIVLVENLRRSAKRIVTRWADHARRHGARRPSVPGRGKRHRPQHHHQHAAGLRHRLGGAFRGHEPGR
jgi:cyclic beta-1,2-glucan synthetase